MAMACCCLLTACNTTTPEMYFDAALLNTNSITGFAGDGLLRQLESPSLKLKESTTNETVAMKRKEIIDFKIRFANENRDELEQLKETEETKEMLVAAKALNDYISPVYKTEYMQLAKMYDDGASKEEIHLLAMHIHAKYFPGFEKLFDKLTIIGKQYAKQHNIKVTWLD